MISGILLAAGTSQRYGSNKLLVPIKNGVPMAVVAARNLLSAVDSITVVVNSDADVLVKLLKKEKLNIICCATAEKGMSESLKTGILNTTEASGWIIALADMPFIQTKTIHAVSKQLRKGMSIAAPYYNNRRGHPVGFSRQHQAELLSLDGDRGALSILEHHPSQIYKIDCNDPAIHNDIDTQADMPF